ncbi:glyoxalase [Fusobacterium polymorphum]|uniref:glyoxalase n=1 Tax=Fusobacterium nucleatum subsp. polymorphum TaxID=76857 RepID=UPI0030D11C54
MLKSFYPVLMLDKIREQADFFINFFNFEESFVCDWYISLKNDNGFELALIDSQHETIPNNYRYMTKGIILNFEVGDVDKIYNSIKDKVNIVYDIKDEDFGQRHFIVEGPNEILIDVIQPIPPSEEFLKNYL